MKIRWKNVAELMFFLPIWRVMAGFHWFSGRVLHFLLFLSLFRDSYLLPTSLEMVYNKMLSKMMEYRIEPYFPLERNL